MPILSHQCHALQLAPLLCIFAVGDGGVSHLCNNPPIFTYGFLDTGLVKFGNGYPVILSHDSPYLFSWYDPLAQVATQFLSQQIPNCPRAATKTKDAVGASQNGWLSSYAHSCLPDQKFRSEHSSHWWVIDAIMYHQHDVIPKSGETLPSRLLGGDRHVM